MKPRLALVSEAILSRLGLPNAAITGASQYAQPTLFFFYTMGAKKLPSQEASPHLLFLTNSNASVSSLLMPSGCVGGSTKHLGRSLQSREQESVKESGDAVQSPSLPHMGREKNLEPEMDFHSMSWKRLASSCCLITIAPAQHQPRASPTLLSPSAPCLSPPQSHFLNLKS